MVIIKGFKMPESCSECPICYDTIECPIGPGLFDTFIPGDDVLKWYLANPGWYLTKRHLRCPLEEFPHGRLIDAGELQKSIHEHEYDLQDFFGTKNYGMFTFGIDYAIQVAPTVIPAEEARTGGERP